MSCQKIQVSFSLNFASLFDVIRDNFSVLFQLKLYMIWTKGAHQSAKFQTFECSRNISPNLYFDRLLNIQYKILAEKVCTEELHFMTLKTNAKFVEKLICCFKNDRNLVNFHPSTQSLKYLHFHWFLLCKIFNV